MGDGAREDSEEGGVEAEEGEVRHRDIVGRVVAVRGAGRPVGRSVRSGNVCVLLFITWYYYSECVFVACYLIIGSTVSWESTSKCVQLLPAIHEDIVEKSVS